MRQDCLDGDQNCRMCDFEEVLICIWEVAEVKYDDCAQVVHLADQAPAKVQ